uniref:ZMYM2-like/QRICH1 C-terminal domain-containing protein n=1 Tax=Amphimedon queenslandica TaxID=400682 RepID=A0A1X7U213_AMPQE
MNEKILWEKGMLGEGSPHKLLKTMIFMCGIYFALRSGQEHRDLKFSQIKQKEIDGKECLIDTENVSKINSGGIKHQKFEPKAVTHYENLHDKRKCFVYYYENYIQ